MKVHVFESFSVMPFLTGPLSVLHLQMSLSSTQFCHGHDLAQGDLPTRNQGGCSGEGGALCSTYVARQRHFPKLLIYFSCHPLETGSSVLLAS